MSRPRWLSLSFWKEWALLTLSFASGGFAVVVALGSYLIGKEPPKSGLLLLLQVCSVLAAWGAWSQERSKRLDLIGRRRPRLVIPQSGFRRIDAAFQQKYLNGDGTLLHATSYPFRSLVLQVDNDPLESSAESVATEVSARLYFLDAEAHELFNIEGRWSDSTQPSNLERHRTPAELKTATIPIGSYRILDLVLKYDHESRCHAVNNESYGFDLFQNPAWRLQEGCHQIRVRLRGPNVDQIFLLNFRNPAGNEPLEVLSFEEVFS
jgi:hypothetical protein